MTILEKYPPNIKDICKVIGEHIMELPRVIFTYGPVIYNPGGSYIDECVGIHEAQHSVQQESIGGPEKWWKKWLHEPKFRMQQELEAYGLQYRRFCELNADRNARARYVFNLASDLSSKQYGSVIPLKEAREQIQRYFGGMQKS